MIRILKGNRIVCMMVRCFFNVKYIMFFSYGNVVDFG